MRERKSRCRRMSKAIVWLTVAVMMLGGMPAMGAESDGEQRVYDQAGLFSAKEEVALEEELSSMRQETGMDVLLVTTKDAEGKSAEQYADDFYDRGGFGDAGERGAVLYLIDMDNRELYISTYQEAIRLLTDERIGVMLDHGVSYLASEDFVGCAEQLMQDTRKYYEQGIADGQYNQDRDTGEVSYYQEKPARSIRWYEALLALAVSAFCAGSVCRKVKRDYAMEKEWEMASGFHLAYRADAGFQFRNQRDELLDSHVTRQIIPRAHHSGGYGGSGHSGRSTTHRSGSGRVHGGGGRKF